MLTDQERAYLDTLKLQSDEAVRYVRQGPCENYGMEISVTSAGVTIKGTVQTLDELRYMANKLMDELERGTDEDKSGQAGHEPAEAMAATAELVTA